MTNNRKVQITGGGTYFVTLPKEWAQRMGIERGARVRLVENATGSLLLVPQILKGKNRVSMSLNGKERQWIERAIISCYITGFDSIELNGAPITPEQRRGVRRTAQSLVGLEIMDEAQDRIVLHCMVSMEDFTADATLKRILAITKAMLQDAIRALIEQDQELASDVIERDMEADRLTLVISREFGLLLRDLLLERQIEMSRILFYGYHAVAKTLERIGDHAVKVSQLVISLSPSLSAELVSDIEELFTFARSTLEGSVVAFMNTDISSANEMLERREQTAEWEERISKGGNDLQVLSTVFDSLLRVLEYAFNIAETVLNVGMVDPNAEAEFPIIRAQPPGQ
ncbi:MAG: PhoU domain-containing protein [Candidatus Bipolaricaulota bacterium]|nr:PhoU domain-containing protein [Candidatus Bipolaricaulota bacterium]